MKPRVMKSMVCFGIRVGTITLISSSQKTTLKTCLTLSKICAKDLGEDFPVVVATTGMPTKRDAKQHKNSYKPIERAQLAIADKEKYPQFVGNIAVVDTKQYWKDTTESPVPNGNQHYHCCLLYTSDAADE